MRPFTRIVDALMLKTQEMRASQFAALPARHADALFLGDSITEGGQWNEWFPELTTLNRGIGGQRSDALMRRMDTVGTADIVFLLIGTNDLTAGTSISHIIDNVRSIVSTIHASQPNATIVMQSVMPRTRKYARRIHALNNHYENLAQDLNVHYLNLWPALATPEGTLDPALTLDGLHLNGAGYAAWVGELGRTIWWTRAMGGRHEL